MREPVKERPVSLKSDVVWELYNFWVKENIKHSSSVLIVAFLFLVNEFNSKDISPKNEPGPKYKKISYLYKVAKLVLLVILLLLYKSFLNNNDS